jgi:hypothetical protein
MKRAPTFEQLREQRELPVVNPDTGARFTISLRDWQGVLWGVRVLPDTPCLSDADNPFVQRHRMVARSYIEEWLEGLRLASTQPPASPARSKATSPATRTEWMTSSTSSA